jgi:hypothetical protein
MTYRNRPPAERKTDDAPARRHRGNALPRFYDIRSVASSLDVSERTVRRWIANGDLIVHRVNGVVRASDPDLRAFLALHRDV